MAIISKLLAISSLLVLSASALDSSNHLGARAVGHHAAVAKRRIDANPVAKRGLKKRCRARPSDTVQAPPAPSDTTNGGSSGGSGGSSGGDNGGSSGGDTSGGSSGGSGGSSGGNTGGNTGGSAGGPSASSKLGLAWPNGPWDLDKWAGHKATWLYTWRSDCPDNAASLGFECVPMLWGRDMEYDFVQATNKDGYARHALFCNEPNQPDQSNMSVEEAVALWRRAFQPLKSKGYRLISASPTSAPSGMDWLKSFRSQCPDCTMDALALHYYDVTVEGFITYMTNFHNEFGLNIWVTEVACQNFNGGAQCDEGQIYDFLHRAVAWMESTEWIERYAFFGTMRDMVNVNYLDRMMNDDGTPNALGWAYIG